MIELNYKALEWPLKEMFTISRGSRTSATCIHLELIDQENNKGRGEAAGIPYKNETPETMAAQIESVRTKIERGIDRQQLLKILPPGGARNAIDAALWDLEAKASGIPVWQAAGLKGVTPLETAQTIGIRSLDEYSASAASLSDVPFLKIKAGSSDDLAALRAVRQHAPNPGLIVDANEAWTLDELRSFMPVLQELRVSLIEQPLPAGKDEELRDFSSPIPLCADESVQDRGSLAALIGKYDVINIKLDKTGGLTEALALANQAKSNGFQLMVGCMVGSSLAMAPATIIAQLSCYVDIDGPLLLADDHPTPIEYVYGVMSFPKPELWG